MRALTSCSRIRPDPAASDAIDATITIAPRRSIRLGQAGAGADERGVEIRAHRGGPGCVVGFGGAAHAEAAGTGDRARQCAAVGLDRSMKRAQSAALAASPSSTRPPVSRATRSSGSRRRPISATRAPLRGEQPGAGFADTGSRTRDDNRAEQALLVT